MFLKAFLKKGIRSLFLKPRRMVGGESQQHHQQPSFSKHTKDFEEYQSIAKENDLKLRQISLNGELKEGKKQKESQDDNLEDDLETDFDQVEIFLNEEEKDLDLKHLKELIDAHPASQQHQNGYNNITKNNERNIDIKRIPKCSDDITPIISNINLNNHLLMFYVKYQKFTQYYVLIQKLRSNVDNLDFIRPIEKEKYFNKEEPSIFPLLFLNNPQTRNHFGYQILLSNLLYKLELFSYSKSLSIMKELSLFDKGVKVEFYDKIWSLFLIEKEKCSVYDLVTHELLLGRQSLRKNKMINEEQQLQIIQELMKRNEKEFTYKIITLIVKLRIRFPINTTNQLNLLLAKNQMIICDNIDSFSLKQLLGIGMVFLMNSIHFEKKVVEALFTSISEKIQTEKIESLRARLNILRYFQNKTLFYLQRIENQDISFGASCQYQGDDYEGLFDQQQEIEEVEQENLKVGRVQEARERQKEDSLTKVFKDSIQIGLKCERLFDSLFNSLVKQISDSNTPLNYFTLYLFMKIVIGNQVNQKEIFDLILKSFVMILQKNNNFIFFAKSYHILSDYNIISKNSHLLSISKIRTNIEQEYFSYQSARLIFKPQESEKQINDNKNISSNNSNNSNSSNNSSSCRTKIKQNPLQIEEERINQKRSLTKRLNISITILWSYILNCIRFNISNSCDLDIIDFGVELSNNIIEDIVAYLDFQQPLEMNIILASQQINNFIQAHKLSHCINQVSIQKLLSHHSINIVNDTSQLSYSSKTQLLFQLHNKYFQLKYNDYIQKNALHKQLIFDVQLRYQQRDYFINYFHSLHFNHQKGLRGIGYLKKYFCHTKKMNNCIDISYFNFLTFLCHHSKKSHVPNYLEYILKLGNSQIKQSAEKKETLQQFEQHIQYFHQQCKSEIDHEISISSSSRNKYSQIRKNQQQKEQ